MKTTLILAALLAAPAALASGAASETYVGVGGPSSSATWLGCDDPTNLGGACFHVAGSSSAHVSVDDATGTSPALFAIAYDAGGSLLSSDFICSGDVFPLPAGAITLDLATQESAVSALFCGPAVATTGTITVTTG